MGLVALDILLNQVAFFINLLIDFESISFVHFVVLLFRQNVLQVFVDLRLADLVEDGGDGLGVVVDDEQLSFIHLPSTLEQHRNVSSKTL